MIIRRAVVQDAEGLVRVHVDTWKTAYRGIIAGEVLDRMSYTGRGERWRQTILEPEGKYIYVAEWNQQDNSSISSPAVVGFAIAGSNRDDDTHVFKGEVHGIYVLDKYQGKGVGRRLFTRAVQSLLQDGMDSVKVWVLADNVKARGFYERLGGAAIEGISRSEAFSILKLLMAGAMPRFLGPARDFRFLGFRAYSCQRLNYPYIR